MDRGRATAPSGELGAAQENRLQSQLSEGSTNAPHSQHDLIGAVEMGIAPRLPVGDFETLDAEAARMEGF